MAGFLNRPLAGTLMGAVALTGAAETKVILPEQYFRTDPGVSLSPANKTVLNIGNAAGQYQSGPYIMRVPAGIKAMRARMFGAQGSNRGGSGGDASGAAGGRLVGDFVTQPGSLMLLILGYQVTVPPEHFRVSVEYGGSQTLGGGFSGIWRLSQAIIDEFAIVPPQDPNALLASYAMHRDKVAAIVDKAKLLMLVGAGGSNGTETRVPSSRGGYPAGESVGGPGGTSGGGGTQTAGGAGGAASNGNGSPGSKFVAGLGRRNMGAGGSGFFGGGGGGDSTGQAVFVSPGGGGSSYFDADEVFYADAPLFGPGTDADSDRPAYTTTGPGVPGRIVLLWD